MSVTVVIPSIPPRARLLRRALGSVAGQTRPPDAVSIAYDLAREGAAATRNRALAGARTEWVAFLDDDDQILPRHLEVLTECAADTGADVVYPWFEVVGGADPLGWFGREFDPVALARANYVPVTVLARAELVRAVGGFQPRPGQPADNPCEDWGCWLAMLAAGARFVHLPERTWRWHHHGANTAGRPDRW